MTAATVMLTACSRAVLIPTSLASSPEYRQPGSYRIRLEGWDEYYARRFSVTDSTVVIEELLKTDDRYKLKRHEMPIVIPLRDVEYIGVMKTNWPVTALILAAGATVLGFFIWFLVDSNGGGFEGQSD